MKSIELEKLKELAKKATPGPWTHANGGMNHKVITSNKREWIIGDAIYHHEDHDASFISAANPSTILKLIERIEELEKKQYDLEKYISLNAAGYLGLSLRTKKLRTDSLALAKFYADRCGVRAREFLVKYGEKK